MKTPLFRSLEAFPPFLMRVLARSRGHCGLMLPTAILAQRSGLSEDYIETLSKKSSWDGIAIDRVDAFMVGCGVKHLRFLRWAYNQEIKKQRPFEYLNATRSKILLRRLEGLPTNHPLFGK